MPTATAINNYKPPIVAEQNISNIYRDKIKRESRPITQKLSQISEKKANLNISLNNISSNEAFCVFKNMSLILPKIEKELRLHKDYIKISQDIAMSKILELSLQISRIPFEEIAIEFTPSNALKFTIQLRKNQYLMLTLPFNSVKDLAENEVIFSLFIDNELTMSNASEISTLVQVMQELCSLSMEPSL